MDRTEAQALLDKMEELIKEVEYRESLSTYSKDEFSDYVFDEVYPQLQEGYSKFGFAELKDPEGFSSFKDIAKEYEKFFSKYEQEYIYAEDIEMWNNDKTALFEQIYDLYDTNHTKDFARLEGVTEYADFKKILEKIPESVWDNVKTDFTKNISIDYKPVEIALLDAVKDNWNDIRICERAMDLSITAEFNKDMVLNKIDNKVAFYFDDQDNDYQIAKNKQSDQINKIARLGEPKNPDVKAFVEDNIKQSFKEIEVLEKKIHRQDAESRVDLVIAGLLEMEKNKPMPTLIEQLVRNAPAEFDKEWREYRKDTKSQDFYDYQRICKKEGIDTSVLTNELSKFVKQLPERVVQDLAVTKMQEIAQDNNMLFECAIKDIKNQLISVPSINKTIDNFKGFISDIQNPNMLPVMSKKDFNSEKDFYKEMVRDKDFIKHNPYILNPNSSNRWINNENLMNAYIAEKINECDKLLQRLETNVIEKNAQKNIQESPLHPGTIRIINSLEYCIQKHQELLEKNPEDLPAWHQHFDDIKETAIEAMAMIEYEIDNNPNINQNEYKQNEQAIMGLLRNCCQLANKDYSNEITYMKGKFKQAFEQEDMDKFIDATNEAKEMLGKD